MLAFACIYPVAILCVKVSICLLYLRLFDRVIKRAYNWAIYFILGFCIFFYLGYLAAQIADVVVCTQVFVAVTTRFCLMSGPILEVISGVANTATDLYLVILPIPMIMKLQMPRRRKLGVASVLGAGWV